MINKDTTDRISLYVPKKIKKKWEKMAKKEKKPLNVWVIGRVELSTHQLGE